MTSIANNAINSDETSPLLGSVVMSKETMNNKRERDTPRTIANRLYKQKIYSLCEKAKKGDKSAELELASELKKAPSHRGL